MSIALYGALPYNCITGIAQLDQREDVMAATTAPLREERLEARITRSQKKLFERAASMKGVSISQFVIASVQEAAARTLEEQQFVELGRRDQEMFVNALLHPEPPNERLRAAVERHGYTPNAR